MLKSLVLAVSTEWDLGFGAPWGRTSVSETKRKGEGLTERTRCMQFREGVGSKGCGEVGCFEKETGMEMSWRCHGWHGMVHYFRCPFLAFLPKIAVRLAPRRPKHALRQLEETKAIGLENTGRSVLCGPRFRLATLVLQKNRPLPRPAWVQITALRRATPH